MHETSHLQQHFYTVSNRLPSFLYFLSQFCFILFSSSSSFFWMLDGRRWNRKTANAAHGYIAETTGCETRRILSLHLYDCQNPATSENRADTCGSLRIHAEHRYCTQYFRKAKFGNGHTVISAQGGFKSRLLLALFFSFFFFYFLFCGQQALKLQHLGLVGHTNTAGVKKTPNGTEIATTS